MVLHQDNPISGATDNPEAALLMMDPTKNRETPAFWTGKVGPCTVLPASAEKKALRAYRADDHEMLRTYLLFLKERWSRGETPSSLELSPRGFQVFLRTHLLAENAKSQKRRDLTMLTAVLAPRVILKGLKAAKHLNGQPGFRGRWIAAKERYEVYLDKGGNPVSVKLDSIDMLPEDRKLFY